MSQRKGREQRRHGAERGAAQPIAIIDLGGQYCHLIARRLRDLGVDAEIFAPDVRPQALAAHAGIILSASRRVCTSPARPRLPATSCGSAFRCSGSATDSCP